MTSRAQTLWLTWLAMLAFAGNSLLCRLALSSTGIDAASFTAIRLLSGALMLAVLVVWQTRQWPGAGSWRGAAALFVYAAAFSFAYLSLPAASGALCLFGAVQATMIACGWWQGERLAGRQWLGFAAALGGLLLLLLPGASAPPLSPPVAGVGYAVASGALASGLGYAIWYRALRGLNASSAATVQLSVPLLTALAGWLLLAEQPGWRLLLAALAILGGIALVIRARPARA